MASSPAFDAIAFATAPSLARSLSFRVAPLARWRACEIEGSAERSHEQVLTRSGRPKEERKVLSTFESGNCRLRQPAG